jgi:hypothetical protein
MYRTAGAPVWLVDVAFYRYIASTMLDSIAILFYRCVVPLVLLCGSLMLLSTDVSHLRRSIEFVFVSTDMSPLRGSRLVL